MPLRGILCLVITVFGWGLTWPVKKILLAELSPWWMLSLRSAIASVTFFAVSAALRRFSSPPRGDIPVLITITLLHMVGFAALAAFGLTVVSTGRSVLLAYTTPLWVLPGAVLLLRETLTVGKTIGVGMGIAGLLVLFSPASLNWNDKAAVYGNSALLMAALLWALSILHIRAHRWRSTALTLAPWETLLAAIILTILAMAFASLKEVHWDLNLVALLIFSGSFGTAAPYWAVAVASRELPAITTSLGLLCTPLVSIVTATIALGESVTYVLLVAAALILGGVILGAVPARRDVARFKK